MTTRRTSSRRRIVVPLDAKKALENEADADFWDQDAFAEDADDKSFDEDELSDRGEVRNERPPLSPKITFDFGAAYSFPVGMHVGDSNGDGEDVDDDRSTLADILSPAHVSRDFQFSSLPVLLDLPSIVAIQDIVDSDFDAPEDVLETGEGEEKALRAEERKTARKARTGKYVDPALQKPGKRKTPASNDVDAGETAEMKVSPPTKQPRVARTSNVASAERVSLRKSTKQASAVAAENRARKAVEDEKRRIQKAERDAKRPEIKIPTQAELLEEAKQTEVANRESLKDLLRLEEEKKRLPVRKKEQTGDIMSLRSNRDGKTTISFTNAKTDARNALFPHLEDEEEKKEKVQPVEG